MPRLGSTLEEKQRWMREHRSTAEPPPPAVAHGSDATAFERHYRPKDLAKLWGLDESTVRRLFQDEPGVFKIGHADRRDGKRDYMSIRIPESVALRVYEERSH